MWVLLLARSLILCVTWGQATYGLTVLLLNLVAKTSLGASSGVQYFSILSSVAGKRAEEGWSAVFADEFAI